MALANNLVAFLLMTTIFGVSLGAVYEVGDSAVADCHGKCRLQQVGFFQELSCSSTLLHNTCIF